MLNFWTKKEALLSIEESSAQKSSSYEKKAFDVTLRP